MANKDLGALWDAWRTRSDEESLLLLLDEVGPELLRAARRYTRDESSAHDLVQETWQAALSKAHAYDARQPLVPWLIGFLLIESKRERRRSARGVDPERLREREEPPPEHAASRDEERRIVRDAVASLPQLYREVVELTFERGLEPAQIAVHLDRAPGTVRVQLHRGLAKLKAALPSGLALGTAVMLLGGTSEAALRVSLVDAALAHADQIARAAPPAAAAGTVAAAWKLAAAIGFAAALGGGVWWALSRSDGAPERATELAGTSAKPAEAESAPTLSGSSADAPVRATIPDARTTASQPLAAAHGVFVVGHVRGFEPRPGSGPVERFAVTLRPADARTEPLSADVAASARFEIDVSDWYAGNGSRPREFFCVVDTLRSMPARTNAWLDATQLEAAASASRGSGRVEIPVQVDLQPAACVVRGRMLAPAGSPRTGRDALTYVALFEVGPDGRLADEPAEATPAAPDGSFRVRTAHAGQHVLVLVHALARPTTIAIQLGSGETHDVGQVLADPGASLAGTVRNTQGAPMVAAELMASFKAPERARSLLGHPIVWLEGRFEHARRWCRADEQGLFFVNGLAPRDYLLETAVGPGQRGGANTLLLPDEAAGSSDRAVDSRIVTAPASGLELRVAEYGVTLRVTADGNPVPGCRVEVESADGQIKMAATTSDLGLLEVRAPQPGLMTLRISKVGFEPITTTVERRASVSDNVAEVSLVPGLAPSRLTFDAGGLDLSGARIQLVPADAPTPLADGSAKAPSGMVPGTVVAKLDRQGSLTEAIPPGRYAARLRESESSDATTCFLPATFDIDVPPGVEYRVRVQLDQGGQFRVPPPTYSGQQKRLTTTLSDDSGQTVTVEFTSSVLRSDARQGQTRGPAILAGASNRSNTLKPGKYTLRVTAPDARAFETTFVIEVGKTVEIPIALDPL